MFLLERIIGIGTYCLALFIFCALIGYSKIKLKRLLIGYTIVLTIIAYFYVPYKTADLYRIFQYVKSFARYDLNTFYRLFVTESSAPGGRLLYWAVGKTGDPHLLPALVALICYGICFYIFYDCVKRYSVNRTTSALVMFFFMSIGHYLVGISNVRTMLSVCLIGYCFYRETARHRFFLWHIPIYILALSLHNFAPVFLLIRLAAILFSSRQSVWIRILTIIGMIALGSVLQFLVPEFTESLLDKAMGYISNEMYSYIWEYIMGSLVLILLLYAFFIYKRSKSDLNDTLRVQTSALLLSIIMAFAFITTFTFFQRIVCFVIAVLSIPFMMEVLSDNRAVRYSRRFGFSIKSITFAFSLAELAVSCSRGSLCGLKFFELGV